MDVPGFALITGAASGIGRACAKAFVNEGSAGVALLDMHEEALIQVKAEMEEVIKQRKGHGNGTKLLMHHVDVSQEQQVNQAISETAQAFGQIDYLVNAAGIAIFPDGGAASLQTEDWSRTLSVNLSGSFFVLRATAQLMLKQEPILSSIDNRPLQRGSIINVASIYGLTGRSQATAYSAAKHGVVGMTRSAAEEYAEAGLRINAICPGYVDTPMIRSNPEVLDFAMGTVKTLVPSRRLGQASEVADGVLYLAGGRSSYVTGSALAVDGGYTAI
ncbi:hypothetical protein XA68_15931 [Ophiocordyceps unilateralis]|uniref:Uncharacterized protein n=1 Tax=Ophiocordyceps unilateralis TaxID=268505 RepID=A0A2A9P5Y3_OPHUN|nr:hypothetical protein XA68_15931 [Ophiocordyceps unilateralis]